MLCPSCRRRIGRTAADCPTCGRSPEGEPGVFDLVVGDGTRVPLVHELTIGRDAGNELRLDDPSVSRHHARIAPSPSGIPVLEDVGSTYGTWLDGRRLDGVRPVQDGSEIRFGDQRLRVERRRSASEAGRTIVVPPGESLVVSASRDRGGPAATDLVERPRLRSGYALKRLDAGEGSRRWVLEDLRDGRFFHFSDADGTLLGLLDGSRPLEELAAESERQLGTGGPARLARLLADLGSRGLVAGGDAADGSPLRPARSLLTPRELTWSGAGKLFDELYRRGGWLLFTRPAAILLGLIGVVGVFVFSLLVVARYGTPFVVARKIGIGGLVFVAGRLAVVAFHETAHGLAMASFGRRAGRAGLKLVLVFPYAYVDTSKAWFEPRRRRIAISAAGPVSDFVLGGVFSLSCLVASPGPVRDICFQVAFGAYVGALFNLNPMLERDGYHILVDLLREPGLRRRAREQLRRRLSGRREPADNAMLRRYALLSIGWSVCAATFVAAMSVRYEAPLAAAVPTPVAWMLLSGLWAALFTPVVATVVLPLRDRFRA
jgi:Zn-dependent protease